MGMVVSFIVGCLILLYLHMTREQDSISATVNKPKETPPMPSKQDVHVTYKVKNEPERGKSLGGDYLDYEEKPR